MKKVFAIPIFFLFVILFTAYVLFPKYQQAQRLERETQERQNLLTLISQEFEQGLEKLTSHTDSIEKIQTALPDEISLANLFNFFQQKSSENGLALAGIELGARGSATQGEETTTSKVEEDYFSLDVFGSYGSLKSFLKTFEGSSRLFEVENISVGEQDATIAAEDIIPGVLEYSILLKVYSK
jgi:Tfp pilus assembly protein PilO